MKLNNLTVLIIDDDIEFQKIIERILSNLGVIVVAKNSVIEALHYIKNSTPDLIILDISIPKHNGFDFLKLRKRIDRLNKIPVMVISAFSIEKIVKHALALGADTFLAKPIINSLLIQKMKQLFLNVSKFSLSIEGELSEANIEIEGKIINANDELFLIESPIKFQNNSPIKIFHEELGKSLVGEQINYVFSPNQSEFKFVFKLHGIDEKKKKMIRDWRYKNARKK